MERVEVPAPARRRIADQSRGASNSKRRHVKPSYEEEDWVEEEEDDDEEWEEKEEEEEEEEWNEEEEETHAVTSRKPAKRSSGVKDSRGEEQDVWEPPNWKQELANIRKMRKKRNAPVDKEGARALADKDCSPEVCRCEGEE